LLLKSFVEHHHSLRPIRLCLVDNGSTDGSKEWLKENGIPFIDLKENIGHENALNHVYNDIKTRYVILNDTDVEYHNNVYDYIWELGDKRISVGELIDQNQMNGIHIKDRISPWFWIFDIYAMRNRGVKYFRDPAVGDWTYDVGSWHWDKMKENGFENLPINRKHWNQDSEIVSMPYERFDHIGKVSWDLDNHGDRYSEVMRRRYYIKDRLKDYEHIDLKGKFIP
jgi:glycosyltransferase involved in cell wall biosynthesis